MTRDEMQRLIQSRLDPLLALVDAAIVEAARIQAENVELKALVEALRCELTELKSKQA